MSFRQRVVQAREDTKGFDEWRRNALLSLGPALLQLWIQLRLNDPASESMKTFGWTVFTFLISLVVIPLIEWSWNFGTGRRRQAEKEVTRLQDIVSEHSQKILELEARIVSLTARFKVLVPLVTVGGLNRTDGSIQVFVTSIVSVINTGAPSAVIGWRVEVALNGKDFEVWQPFPLQGQTQFRSGSDGPVMMTLNEADYIVLKTMSTPIQNGGHVMGYLCAKAPPLVSLAQAQAPEFVLRVSCCDVDGQWFSSDERLLKSPQSQGHVRVIGFTP